MAGYDDSIFGNLPSRPLPGSPRRPKPPPDNRSLMQTMFPVDPREVVGGLSDLATQGAGRAAAYAAGHGPLDALAPAATAPASAQSSADKFGGDITAMLQSPIHGGFNPDTAMHATLAAAPLALAARTGRTAEEIATGAAKGGITAYHGSPYNFDRFDMSKIGTGEGAQAYGHGLYFADSEGVAKSYRDALTAHPISVNVEGKPVSPMDAHPDGLSDDEASAVQRLYEYGNKDVPSALAAMKRRLGFTDEGYAKDRLSQDISTIEGMKDRLSVGQGGHMYQVNINADPNDFLDWDKPVSDLPSDHQAALAALPGLKAKLAQADSGTFRPGTTVGTALQQAKYGGYGDEFNANALRDAGIPGIKYLDQGSRGGGGDPTHNYVTFSDDMIDILKKYGLAGLGLTAGAGALSASGQSPVSSPAEAAPPQGMTLGAQPNWSP